MSTERRNPAEKLLQVHAGAGTEPDQPANPRTSVQKLLPMFLDTIRRVKDPSVYRCDTALIEPLKPSAFRLLERDEIDLPKAESAIMVEKLHELNIDVNPPEFTDDASSMTARFKLLPKVKQAPSCKFASPWYAEIHCQSPDTPQEVADILRAASAAYATEQFVFRGEPELYPSVTSTLARRWNTDSPEALRALVAGSLKKARQYLSDEETEDLNLSAAIQHMGGATNLVDFSTEVWVALFFACLDAHVQPDKETTGRLYALKREAEEPGILIRSLKDRSTSPVQQSRWDQQRGVVVIPETGTVPFSILEVIAIIKPEHKVPINQFLRSIGVSTETMFKDLEGYMRYEQNNVPVAAICHMAMRYLEKGEAHRVPKIADPLNRVGNTSHLAIAHYLRGLCHATQGHLRQSRDDINEFRNLRHSQSTPEYVTHNLKTVERALARNRHMDYNPNDKARINALSKRLRFDIDHNLWIDVLGHIYQA